VQRLKPPLGPALARRPPSRERHSEALQALRPEIVELEKAPHQPARPLTDHHTARRGQRLQARCQARRLADHRPLLRLGRADQIADHHQPGGNPDPHLQPRRPLGLQLNYRFDQSQPGAHRPLGIVFMRLRPAEVGEHAVTQILGDVTFEPLDHGCGAVLVGAHDAAQVLGVDSPGEFGRAHEITEQHRQLATFGLERPRDYRDRLRGCRGLSLVERGDGVEELSPVSD
jgi:hypothetical protein